MSFFTSMTNVLSRSSANDSNRVAENHTAADIEKHESSASSSSQVANTGNVRLSSIRGGSGPSPARNASHGTTTAGETSRTPSSGEKTEDGKIIHDWDGPNDPENPFNWSPGYKWFLTVTVCFISILTGIPAGAYGAGNDQMAARFNVQNEPFPNLYWATCSWNVGAALFPLLFVPLTENTGRMPGYFAAYIVFEIFLFPSAFAQNFATLVVTRFVGGGASSVAINIVGGSIADVWKGDKDRSIPMSLFGFTSVAGIALGPFVGAAIIQAPQPESWRWIYYIQIIYNGALIPVFYFILKETRGDVILAKRAAKIRKETGQPVYARSELQKNSVPQLLSISLKRPVRMLLTEPVVTFFTLWVSFAWGILFLFFSSIGQTYGTAYGFGVFQTGMIDLALTVGALIGTLLNPIQDKLYMQSARRNKQRPGKPIPEARLYFAVPGSLLFTAGLFMFGWTVRSSIHWIVPTVAVTMIAVGIYSIYLGVVNYLTDAYEKFAASALSAASLGRNAFGAFLPLATYQLFANLGYGWAGTLLGFVGLALSIVPVVLLYKGEEIRRKSPFMLEAMYDEEEHEERRNSWGVGLPHGSTDGASVGTVPKPHPMTGGVQAGVEV